jgi:hypothetical protein
MAQQMRWEFDFASAIQEKADSLKKAGWSYREIAVELYDDFEDAGIDMAQFARDLESSVENKSEPVQLPPDAKTITALESVSEWHEGEQTPAREGG